MNKATGDSRTVFLLKQQVFAWVQTTQQDLTFQCLALHIIMLIHLKTHFSRQIFHMDLSLCFHQWSFDCLYFVVSRESVKSWLGQHKILKYFDSQYFTWYFLCQNRGLSVIIQKKGWLSDKKGRYAFKLYTNYCGPSLSGCWCPEGIGPFLLQRPSLK